MANHRDFSQPKAEFNLTVLCMVSCVVKQLI